jgi:hypothetical protein
VVAVLVPLLVVTGLVTLMVLFTCAGDDARRQWRPA